MGFFMGFFTFIGGLVICGLLWLLLPRASFCVTLGLLFVERGVFNGKMDTGATITMLVLIVGAILGGMLDIAEHAAATE